MKEKCMDVYIYKRRRGIVCERENERVCSTNVIKLEFNFVQLRVSFLTTE